MRIFKRKFSEELTRGMSVGECIITRVSDTQYGSFVVYKKVSDGAFPYLGCFPLLQEAIAYATTSEKPEERYEYYLQNQAEFEEGWDKDQLQVMGTLGWELCGIQSNITDERGRAMFIYKRKLPYLATNPEGLTEQLRADNELEYTIDSKITTLETSPNSIRYCFGKNGQGITDELIKLGGIIKNLSTRYRVYLNDAQFDTIDDVYYITIDLIQE